MSAFVPPSPLEALEALFRDTPPDGAARLRPLLAAACAPSGMAVAAGWELDRSVALCRALLAAPADAALRRPLYVVLYKLAYYVRPRTPAEAEAVDTVLRALQQRLRARPDPTECAAVAAVYARLHGYARLDTLLLDALDAGGVVRDWLFPAAVGLLCGHGCAYAAAVRPDWMTPGRAMVPEPPALTFCQRNTLEHAATQAFPYKGRGDGDADMVAMRDVFLCLATHVPVLPLWCLFVAPDVHGHPLAPLVAMRRFADCPEQVVGERLMLTRLLDRCLGDSAEDASRSIWWFAWYYLVFRSLPHAWVARGVPTGRTRLERLIAAVHSHHIRDGRTHPWAELCAVDAAEYTRSGWPWPWLIRLLPPVWFPTCARHADHVPSVIRRLTVTWDDERGSLVVTPCADGGIAVGVVPCDGVGCACVHRLAYAHVETRYPGLASNAQDLLRGDDPVLVSVTEVPRRNDAEGFLPPYTTGHSAVPELPYLAMLREGNGWGGRGRLPAASRDRTQPSRVPFSDSGLRVTMAASSPDAMESVPASLRCLFLGRFRTVDAVLRHMATENPNLDEGHLYPESVRRWDAYCDAVERRILGIDDSEREVPAVSVFGTCRRCGSSRLLVTTRQLRRADEGMTEIRQCKACGHVTKVNS